MTRQTPQLDPKLRQAYDRVMGVSSTSTTTQKTPIGNATIPIMPDMQKVTTPASVTPAIPTVNPLTSATPMSNAAGKQGGVAMAEKSLAETNISTPVTTAPVIKNIPRVDSKTHGYVAPKKNQTISPVVIVVAVVAFMLIYGVFWIKFFGLKIPFISQ